MTIEELAAKWSTEADQVRDLGLPASVSTAYTLDRCASELRAIGEGWIKVSERLPEYHERVLIVGKYCKVTKGFLMDQWYDENLDQWPDTTHWRPLPEPPKEKAA